MSLYCCTCKTQTRTRLVTGELVYPNNRKLEDTPFILCTQCKTSFVGCHPNTRKPLGPMAGTDLRRARSDLHGHMDRLWKRGVMTRKEMYKRISEAVGFTFHTGSLKTVEEAEKIKLTVLRLFRDEFIELSNM